jgi:hypothetical protein
MFWRLPIHGGSQNMDYIKEKKQYIPRLTEEYMSIYSSVGIYGHMAGVRGVGCNIFLGYV